MNPAGYSKQYSYDEHYSNHLSDDISNIGSINESLERVHQKLREQSSQRYPSNHDVNVTSTTPKLCMIRPNKTKMRDLSKTHPLWTKMLHQDETKISGNNTKLTTSGLLYRALFPIDLTAIGNYYINIMQLNIFAL